MKKIIAMLLALVLVVGLVACGAKKNEAPAAPAEGEQTNNAGETGETGEDTDAAENTEGEETETETEAEGEEAETETEAEGEETAATDSNIPTDEEVEADLNDPELLGSNDLPIC